MGTDLCDLQTLFLLHDSDEATPAELKQLRLLQQSAGSGKPQHVGRIGWLGGCGGWMDEI